MQILINHFKNKNFIEANNTFRINYIKMEWELYFPKTWLVR